MCKWQKCVFPTIVRRDPDIRLSLNILFVVPLPQELEVSMLDEVASLCELTADLGGLCRNPKQLPTSTEQLIQDYINQNKHGLINSNQSMVSPDSKVYLLINSTDQLFTACVNTLCRISGNSVKISLVLHAWCSGAYRCINKFQWLYGFNQ